MTPTAQAKAPAASPPLAYYPVEGSTNSLTHGKDGNVWFSDGTLDKIGKITPTGNVTEYPLSPPLFALPGGITSGPDGNLWFLDRATNRIGIMNLGGGFVASYLANYAPNGSQSGLYSITAGSDGNLWFTEDNAHAIGRITPAGQLAVYPIPSGKEPGRMTLGPDGNLWFTDGIDSIGRITPQGSMKEYYISVDAQLTGVTTGPDGNIWFSEYSAGIGHISPTGTNLKVFDVNGIGLFSSPENITKGSDGNLWFTDGLGAAVGYSTPSGTMTEYAVPFAATPVSDITAGPDGNIWFAGSAEIGKVTLAKGKPVTRQKVFFFVQGVTSTLTHPVTDIAPTSFGQANGIYQAVKKSFPGSAFEMFSYSSNPTTTNYTCPDTFNQHLSTFAVYLLDQIRSYMKAHANSDVYVIGHSQGGAISFALLELLANGNKLNTNGSIFKGVTTLDSPLGGVPGSWNHIIDYVPYIEAKYRKDPDCTMGIPTFTSLLDLTHSFKQSNTPDYGGNDLLLPLAPGSTSHLTSNNSVALNEGLSGVSVMTVGNTADYLYDPTVCIGWGTGHLQERFYSTQWVFTMALVAHVYPRAFTQMAAGTNPHDPCINSDHVSENHSLVLTNTLVIGAIIQFVKGQVPSLPDPNRKDNP